MTFLDLALSYARRGWYVFPCWPEAKQPMTKQGWHDATIDETQITAWWMRTPNANIGIACGPSNLAVLDCDHGLPDSLAAVLWLESIKIPSTYMVRTGRRPEFGLQIYFRGAVPDVGLWKLGGCEGQIKSLGGYVMAAGSIHPDTKEAYSVESDAPLADTPDVVRNLRTVSLPVKTGPMEKIPEGAGRHHALTSVAGKLRNSGLDADAIHAALIPVNESMCEVPLSDGDLQHIAQSIGKKPLPEPLPEVTIGNKPTVEVDTSEDEDELPEDSARPLYPDAVWAGTFYDEFAETCSAGNFVPKKFFSESLRTVVGAIVGGRLSSTIDGANARAYTILITNPGGGKGTACDRVRQLFSENWEGLKTSCEPPLLFGPKDYDWRTRGIGAQILNMASAPGLMKALEPRKLVKGESANPLEVWKPIPRIVSIQEEVRGLFANFQNEATGAGLESVICELYDRTSFSTTATKDRQPLSGDVMYSLLGGITKEGWDAVFSRLESTESGFLSRVNIIGSEEDRRVADLPLLDFTPLRNRLLPFIQALITHPRQMKPTPMARAFMSEWFAELVLPEGIPRSRLNIHAWRTALHLAWLHGHEFMTEEDVEGGIQVAEYQAKMREFYAPPEGETRQARCEAAIRKVMRAKRRMSVGQLKRETHYNRFGIGLWDKALKALVQEREVRVETDKENSRRARVFLLKTAD